MNRSRMEEGIRIFVEGIGERFDGDDLDRTPPRVAQAWHDDPDYQPLIKLRQTDSDMDMILVEGV